jgi:hypothetical protein
MNRDWNELGNVVKPGYYRLAGVGIVEVSREDINRAAQLGGNPVLTLGELHARQDDEPTFGIRSMRPR